MRSTFLLTMTGLIVLGFVLFMVTFSVRFTEAAVVTTFGKASETSVVNQDGDEAGLYFKWPYPVQSVTKYDRRVRILESRSETQLTADDRPIIVDNTKTAGGTQFSSCTLVSVVTGPDTFANAIQLSPTFVSTSDFHLDMTTGS